MFQLPPDKDIQELVLNAIYAAIGTVIGILFSMLRYAQDFLNDPRPAFRWWIWAIKAVTGGAVGFLATLVALDLHWNPYVSGVFIGASGWAGAETLNALKEASFDALRKWLGSRAPQGTQDRETKG